jgi:xylulokinase
VGAALLAARGIGLEVAPRREPGRLAEPRPSEELRAAARRWRGE